MNRTEIFVKLEEIFKDLLDDEAFKLSEGDSAETINEWDSLFHITLMTTVEDEFKISLATEAVANAKNIGVLVDMIAEELNK